MVMWLRARMFEGGVLEVFAPKKGWIDINRTPYWLVGVTYAAIREGDELVAIVRLTNDGTCSDWR